MDINHPDVVPDIVTKTICQMRLKFADGTIISPSDVFEQVQKLIRENIKEIKPKVGKLGELFVGYSGNNSSLFFAYGFYFRKAIESQEKIHGKCDIQFETEELSMEQLKNFLAKYLKRQSEKFAEAAESVMRNGIPEEYLEDD